MGKTIPAFRITLESEIARWINFRKTLASEEEREACDELMDMCRNNTMAAGNASNPIIFEPMMISMLLSQQKKMIQLEFKLNELL